MDQMWMGLLLAGLGLLGVMFFQRSSNKDTDQAVKHAKTEAELKAQQEKAIQDLETLEKGIQETKKKLEDMTPEEVEKYWNNR